MAIGHEHFWAKKKLLVEKGGVHLPEATPDLRLATFLFVFHLHDHRSWSSIMLIDHDYRPWPSVMSTSGPKKNF